jgi:uncharacterized protein YlxW (UPF0749 family)
MKKVLGIIGAVVLLVALSGCTMLQKGSTAPKTTTTTELTLIQKVQLLQTQEANDAQEINTLNSEVAALTQQIKAGGH